MLCTLLSASQVPGWGFALGKDRIALCFCGPVLGKPDWDPRAVSTLVAP